MLSIQRWNSVAAATLIFAVATTAMPAKAAAPPHLLPHTAILPLSEGHNLWCPSSGYWEPSIADVRQMETHLPKYLSSYYRQYLGVVRDGKRLIYVNGFSADVASEFIGGKYDWHTHAAQVDDGGTAFFNATYDPHTKQFSGPDYNGLG